MIIISVRCDTGLILLDKSNMKINLQHMPGIEGAYHSDDTYFDYIIYRNIKHFASHSSTFNWLQDFFFKGDALPPEKQRLFKIINFLEEDTYNFRQISK